MGLTAISGQIQAQPLNDNFSFLNERVDILAYVYNVKEDAYGAVGDGVTDDTVSIQAAIDAASDAGGGIVFFPKGKYYTTGVFSIPSNVHLRGIQTTHRDGASIAQIVASGSIFYITNLTTEFITLDGNNITIEGLTFYYPNQVAPTTSPPTVYPVTILGGTAVGTHINLRNLTFINAYEAIEMTTTAGGGSGRATFENLLIGSFLTGITLDASLDVTRFKNIQMSPIYDNNETFPTLLDTWAMANGTGIKILRADAPMMENIFIHAKNIGIQFDDSTNAALSSKNSYGQISNLSLDFVTIGIYAQSTHYLGWDISNLFIAANSDAATKIGIKTFTGGTVAPNLRIHGGAMWGDPNGGYLVHNTGTIEMTDVFFDTLTTAGYFNCAATTSANLTTIGCNFKAGGSTGIYGVTTTFGKLVVIGNKFNSNNNNLIPGTDIPANARITSNDVNFGLLTAPGLSSAVTYTNNFGINTRVFISGTAISTINLNSTSTGLTSGSFLLAPQDTIAITYTLTPTWTWFGMN